MTRRSRTSLAGILARQFRADLGQLLAMTAIVFVIATIAAAAPLALRAMTTAEVAYQLESHPAVRRDLLGTVPLGPLLSKGDDPFREMYDGLAGVTAEAPKPLSGALGAADFVTVTDSHEARLRSGADSDPISRVTFDVAPHLAPHIRITEGAAPEPFHELVDPRRVPSSDNPEPLLDAAPDETIDIMLSSVAATKAEWPVGEARRLDFGLDSFQVRLSGVFEPIDPLDSYWAMEPRAIDPGLDRTPPEMGYILIVTGAAFIDPGSWPVMAAALDNLPVTTTIGIRVSTASLSVDEVEGVLPQLRHFMDTNFTVGKPSPQSAILQPVFHSEAADFLDTALQRAATATVVLAMVASGPIGVAIAVLWLLSRLIVLRRRPATALASARGASGTQLRLAAALECLVLTVPAAAAGAAVAAALLPASWGPTSLWFAGGAALVPPILLAVAARPTSLRGERGDLDPAARSRFRWVLEVIVLVLAALSGYLLLQRGLTTNTGRVGVDPLLAAAPLLLSLSAGLLALRLYPLPLLGIARWLRRRRGIVAFLGTHRAIRDPAAGFAPVLAMAVGLSVAVFSGVLLGTVSNGTAIAARTTVGADLRIESPHLSEKQLDDLAAIPGVAELAGVRQYTKLTNLSVGDNLSVPILLTDTAALTRVQAGVQGAARFTVDMTKEVGSAIPVLLSPSLHAKYTIDADSSLGNVDIVDGGDPGYSPSLSGVDYWVLVDKAFSDEVEVPRFLPKLTLLKLEPGADASAVARAASVELGPDALVQSPADVVRQLEESPVSSGLQFALLAFTVMMALLGAATVVLALMISAPARERLLALLRIVGLRGGQARGITAWEIGPTAAVAIVTGILLGVVLPLILLSAVDLRPFTGGVLQPPIAVDPLVVGSILGGFAALVVVATTVAMAAARRVSLARTIRTAEEG
jgi:putative ABC transport system permease protein